jgi:hypothetical protein
MLKIVKMEIKKRLKNYLFTIMKQEGEIEAWEQFAELEPNCDELDEIIMYTPFYKEAWEKFKLLDANIDDLLHIVEYVDDQFIQNEAANILLDSFTLDSKTLEKIVSASGNDKAAKLLLNGNPSMDQLETIVRYSNLRDEAAKEMLKNELEIDELFEIIKHSSLKSEAWEKFIQQSPTTKKIIEVIQETDFDDTAWSYLIQQKPSNDDLSDLINDYGKTGKKRNETAEYILNNNPAVGDLDNFLYNELRVEDAWELMAKMTPSESELSPLIWILIRLGCSLKNEVAEWCLKFNPSKKDLWYILEYSDQKDEAARQLIKKPLALHEFADILAHSTAEPVLALLSERIGFDRSSVNETELIQEIANKILNDSALLDVNNWHNGNKHCVGGWAITLNARAQEIEKEYGSEIAACLLLPNYKHLFFTEKEKVIEELQLVKLNS